MITVVPPHSDVSLTLLADGKVVDVNTIFLHQLLGAGRITPGAGRAAALLARAGRAALRNRLADPPHRLRGLGAVLSGLATPDHGVRLRLDDLELAEGSTQRGADVLRAATAAAPYDDAIDRAVELVADHPEVTVVIERDQQLPAALRLADRLAGRTLRVTGRYATACWPVLSGLSSFATARVDRSPHGLRWRVVDPFGGAGVPELPWRERASDPSPPGRWAGRVALRDIGAVQDAHTVILGLCATPDAAVGRGGTTVPWSTLDAAVRRLRDNGTRILAELWIGAPGIDPARAPEGLRAVSEAVDRVAGLRVFDWPVGWTRPHWADRPVRVVATGDDLARHQALVNQTPMAQLTSLVTELGRPLARAGTLVPGRIAACYLVPTPRRPAVGPQLDPDVVLGARGARDGRGIAVNLRTGTCTAVDGPIAELIAARSSGATPAAAREATQAALSTLPAALVPELIDGDVLLEPA